jgi:hypothetical protein
MVGNRERNVFIRVSKLNERNQGNVSGSAGPGIEVGTDGTGAQVIGGRVLQIAEAIIGHDQKGSGAVCAIPALLNQRGAGGFGINLNGGKGRRRRAEYFPLRVYLQKDQTQIT